MTCAALCAAGCATTRDPAIDYATGRPTLNEFTLAREVDLGTKLATALIASAEVAGRTIDPDDEVTRAVWRVTARLLEVPENRARMPPLPWEVHVIGAPAANAWCFPGGNLLVSAGMLRSGMARDEDELAALIGHELGHAAARHGTEKLSLEALEARLGPLGTFFGPRLVELAHPDTPQRIQAALEQGMIGYDVVQEIEADILGLELMARAGYDPARAAAIWARRADDTATTDAASHPQSAERARVLAEHVGTARYVASRRAAATTGASTISAVDAAGARTAATASVDVATITSTSGAAARTSTSTSWAWTPALAGTRSATVGITATRPLPHGPHIRRLRATAPPALLDAEVRVRAGPEGEGLRAAVELQVGRDLREDGLPYTAELAIVHVGEGPGGDAPGRGARGPPVAVYALANQATLDAAVVRMRIALAPLPPGRYRARVRVDVGAVRAERVRLFEVGQN